MFNCSYKWRNGKKEKWTGEITKIYEYNDYVEVCITSRSSLWVMCGKGERGYWACIPDYNVGCTLGDLSDTFFNTERLMSAMKNKVDAITVAEALGVLSKHCII